MNSLLTLACLLLTLGPQEKPPVKETPPPQNTNAALEAALESIKNAKPVEKDGKVPAGSTLRQTDDSVRGSRAAARTSYASDGRHYAAAPEARQLGAAAKASDLDKKVSDLFIANALYQQELANRKQAVSVSNVDTPEAALAELQAGNVRFVEGKRVRTLMTAQDPELREKLEKGQAPFAVVVTCSDSRAMDNLIFDQDLGRLFTIRVAGNTPGTLGIASIEYAVEHLGSKIVVIMGHSKCGAVGAVADAKGKPLPDNLYTFQEHMAGLLDVVVKDPNETDAAYKGRLERENAIRQAQTVYNRSHVVRELVDHKKIWLLPAVYDLHTGKTTFFKLIEGGSGAGAGGHHDEHHDHDHHGHDHHH